MPDLIILRLHPSKPMAASNFTTLLTGLEIKAFDLSFDNSSSGVVLGTAKGLADPHLASTTDNSVNITNTSILQHYVDVMINVPLPSLKRRLESVATAVIVATPPAGHKEYPTPKSYDVRLELTRAGLSITDRVLEYNVSVVTVGALSNDQKDSFAMAASAYVTLPAAGLDPALAHVDISATGQPPPFRDLCDQISKVLAKDPGPPKDTLAKAVPLTAAQSQQIAAEIVFDRKAEPPPDLPDGLGADPFGAMYTKPEADPSVTADDADKARSKFEAELTGWYGTLQAETLRLTGFVFSASAAIVAETMSRAAERARFEFPVVTGAPGGTISHGDIAVTKAGGLDPAFLVPADYFYALAANMPAQVRPEQRYDMARLTPEPRLLDQFDTAADATFVAFPVSPFLAPGDPKVNPDQAARRLVALGSALGSLTSIELKPPIKKLVADWLTFTDKSEKVDHDFWEVAEIPANQAAYLELLLELVTEDHQPLIAAIKAAAPAGLGVTTAAGLAAVDDTTWRELFVPTGQPPNLPLLPPFTQPGTPSERAEAFIRHLKKFFDVPINPPTGPAATPGAPPTLPLPTADAIASFVAQFPGGPLVFGSGASEADIEATAKQVFSGDVEAQLCLAKAITAIDALVDLATVAPAELRFSIVEALYARGFTSATDVQKLTPGEFQQALIGSVAYPFAVALYAKADGTGGHPAPPPGPFSPVNPDGLADCVPPLHLSPLGPVEYLHELLEVSPASTCNEPLQPNDPKRLELALAGRRGPLGDLHATKANLETPLPVIDMATESLEALVDGLPAATGGAVYDTGGDTLAGHRLAADGEVGGDPYAHDPATLLGVLPEHSSPATPVEKPHPYELLAADFSAPALPYAQGLDICRSYLGLLGSTRFSAMRHFRKAITEFAIDAAHEPADFPTHLWRYPVRIETALEYLHVSPAEHELLFTKDIAVAPPAPGQLILYEVYGFANDVVGDQQWTDIVQQVAEFIERTGLTYCEFVQLWRSGFVEFRRAGRQSEFPDCQPCCPDNLVIEFPEGVDPLVALRKLAVFIRLWRILRTLDGCPISVTELADICEVLHLFENDKVNPEFIRQLAALVMLRDLFDLPLVDCDEPVGEGTGADRTHLLALWVGAGAAKWNWAVHELVESIEGRAEGLRPTLEAQPELGKLLVDNLDPLSRLAGFDPSIATDTWHAQPTSTLRFAEVLLKIYASEFTVGEVLFLFTPDVHLDGDDPFPLQTDLESRDNPLDLPDDDRYSLWALRRKLLEVEPDAESAEAWTWLGIVAALRDELGYAPAAGSDPLYELGAHFFPSVLEREDVAVPEPDRRFRTPLAAAGTTPLMWNTPPDGPFRYDATAQELWAELPLRDAAVAEKLSEIRPLAASERAAVRELYFAPRALLAPFALVFSNFGRAADELVRKAEEERRFAYFRREFDRFHRRCCAIVEHLAEHVDAATGTDDDRDDVADERRERSEARVAWRILRQLHGDENAAGKPWEDDSGQPPQETWGPPPTGGAFAALLGLAGTGLLGELSVAGHDPAWRETRGPLTAFGRGRNRWNAPVPTVIPSPDLTLTPEQQRFAAVRNGFALRDVNGEPLLGEEPGRYRFAAGAPTPNGQLPDEEAAEDKRWRVTIRRGQKSWILLNHEWGGEEAPKVESRPLALRRGVYELVIELDQQEPTFEREEEVCPRHTGFQIKYEGPDTDERLVAIPYERLYRDRVDAPLDDKLGLAGSAAAYLHSLYTSSLRDVRRTYQRAFKAVLFAHRFHLSAERLHGDRQSELGHLLDHAETFQGRSYYRKGPASFGTHRAWFDFDFLPVGDPYAAPEPTDDERAGPSAKREAALFDWWERLYDYTTLRRETRKAREQPAWRLFYEAGEHQPDDPAELLRHLGVDIRHAPLVETYFALPEYQLKVGDLESEEWALRAWRAEEWIRALERRFYPIWIGDAKPSHWASDDPSAAGANDNLTAFVRNGSFENGDPRRYDDIEKLNDGLRIRARDALVAYLCAVDRVGLPFAPGHFATIARDLSDLLLQDVEAGICERASRIEYAVSSVHAFVQRARLGLEPSFLITPAFVDAWDHQFATFRVWECCQQRKVYRENWIEWDDLRAARDVEAFRFLENELREAKLTIAEPGGMVWWPNERPPVHPSLLPLQAGEPGELTLLDPGREGLDLLGTRDRHARPSWLAPLGERPESTPPPDDEPPPVGEVSRGRDEVAPPAAGAEPRAGARGRGGVAEVEQPAARVAVRAEAMNIPKAQLDRLPLWIQAAVRMGTRFVRVAAAGIPPATAWLGPCDCDCESACCDDCCRREPLIDEYYFWLVDSRHYEAVVQDADVGITLADPAKRVLADDTTNWHRPKTLPGLLHWDPEPMVHLHWCRVHNGEFQPPHRSDEGLAIDPKPPPGTVPDLAFMGRTGDSLRFTVAGGITPPGYLGGEPPGFRYDIATDAAVVLPLVPTPPTPAPTPGPYPGGLDAYPFFAYFCPGAPVEPLSLFSVALTVAGALRANCQFEAALKWYELVFDPLDADDTWAQCYRWEERPPREPRQPRQPAGDQARSLAVGEEQPLAGAFDLPPVRFRRVRVPGRGRVGDDQPCCPTEAQDDFVARNRAVLLHYLETLLQWGDALLCRNSPEAFRQADVLIDVLSRVLGPQPPTILAADTTGPPPSVAQFEARPAPVNPRLMALYDRTGDRLDLIHRCLNAHRLRNGRPNVDMSYFGDDPQRDGWLNLDCTRCECDGWCVSCCDAYRFTVRVQKALELANDVRALGAELLAAYEKGDAEYLAALRASHERQLLELGLDIRQNQWRDADWQVQALQKTKEGAQTRLRYYQTLIANGLNAGEIGYQSQTNTSTGERAAANVSSAIAQAMVYVPDFSLGVAGIAGTPLQFNQLPLGSKLAAAFTTAAHILTTLADIASSNAGLNLTQGGWDRRLDEWRHQVEVIGIEIEQIERQILGAERRRDVALRELNNHQRQIENSIEVQDFLRDKFTNHELYLFLQQETAALYRQAYELALLAARQAQHAFNYERGYTTRRFLPENGWDTLHEGLLAGERLQLAVRQMEKAYQDENCREYELTKHVSLRLNFPLAFLRLQTTGICEIELPEWLFDLDYPGHYMRRIKNVTLTIPAVVGPYTGVHCRLTLLSSTTRIDPRLDEPRVACCTPGDPCCECEPCCCERPVPNGYELAKEDARVVRTYAATEAIATSSGQNDSGLFELSFRDERYLPFEFAGAVSRWRIELPLETNYFDFDTLSDVVLHLNYTAREGGDVLRDAAAEDARCRLPGDGLRLIDVRRDLSDAWYGLQRRREEDEEERGRSRQLDLRLGESMFPFVPGRRVRWIEGLQIFFVAPNAIPDTNYVVEFEPAEHEHEHEAECDCDRIDVHCIASSEWPGTFWGVVDLRGKRLGPLGHDRPAELGCFEFPDELGEICGVQLVAGYCAEEWPRCGPPPPRRPCCGCCGRRDEEERDEEERPRQAPRVRRGGGG
jgi:hypothetical protein